MDFNKCSRCGSFYLSGQNVCPRCASKDNLEFSTFKNYIHKNGLENSLDKISGDTGITVKNLNRFVEYQEFQNSQNQFNTSNIYLNNKKEM